MRKLTIVFVFAGLFAQLSADQSLTHVIDLVAVPRQPAPARPRPQSEQVDAPVTVSSHAKPVALPFKITLVGLDRSDYAIGDDFIFEILCENVGPDVFSFPTSPDQHRFSRKMIGLRAASLGIVVSTEALGTFHVGTTNLYGSEDVADSFVEVKPGESVRVRAEARWRPFVSAGRGPDWSDTGVQARAWLDVHFTGQAYTQPVSQNAVTVLLRRKQ